MSHIVELNIRDFFALSIVGFQFEHITNGWDANWLKIECRCRDESSSATLSGPFLMTADLVNLQKACRDLSSGQKDSYKLEPIEPVLEISIRVIDTLRHFEIRVFLHVPDVGPENHSKHTYVRSIDQTDLMALDRQLTKAMQLYPVRGSV